MNRTVRPLPQGPRIDASACPHDCPSTCALEVEVLDNNRIGRVRGAEENAYTADVICAKVARYAERVHHPDRLMQPLRRMPAVSDAPPNIQEFNTIAGLIFAQLYGAFPVVVDIDRNAIAKAMDVPDGNYKLPSGRTFNEIFAHTIAWLAAERYTMSAGTLPAERASLTS